MNYTKKKVFSLSNFIIAAVVISSCLTVSIKELWLIHFSFLLLLTLLGFFKVFFGEINKNWLRYILFFYLPFIVSTFFSLPINLLFNSKYDYSKLEIVGRITNIVLLIVSLMYINHRVVSGKLNHMKIFKFYS